MPQLYEVMPPANMRQCHLAPLFIKVNFTLNPTESSIIMKLQSNFFLPVYQV